MFEEFKKFIARGNVMDMAVGIIMGASFTAIVKSMVDDLIMPFVGLFTRGINFSQQFITLDGKHYDTLEQAKAAMAPVLTYGIFINAVLSFLIVAFVVFMLVRTVNKIKDSMIKKEEEAKKDEPIVIPQDVLLLQEIRDLLKSK